ncbi:MAG: hypothetical protein M0030_04535 [Actinomycetota bacterium]|nr:hypothetical protein [Actinomycetota bacterium]
MRPRVGKYVINLDSGTGRKLVCSWDDCDKPGFEMHKHIQCLHDARAGCVFSDQKRIADTGQTAHLNHVFCSERHRAYFVAAYGRNAQMMIERTGRAYGNLPPGMRHRAG